MTILEPEKAVTFEEPPKFCVDCEFYISHPMDSRFSKCNNAVINIVNSDYLSTKILQYASTARRPGAECGPNAKHFVYKPKREHVRFTRWERFKMWLWDRLG